MHPDTKDCITCKYGNYDHWQKPPCDECHKDMVPIFSKWEPEDIEPKETPVTDDKNISMIKSIIDEAMEKRDRTVSVYVHGDTMSVSVTPIGADEPRWIPKEGGYVCSTCGQWELNSSRYCRICGEALKNMDMFTEESEDNDN